MEPSVQSHSLWRNNQNLAKIAIYLKGNTTNVAVWTIVASLRRSSTTWTMQNLIGRSLGGHPIFLPTVSSSLFLMVMCFGTAVSHFNPPNHQGGNPRSEVLRYIVKWQHVSLLSGSFAITGSSPGGVPRLDRCAAHYSTSGGTRRWLTAAAAEAISGLVDVQLAVRFTQVVLITTSKVGTRSRASVDSGSPCQGKLRVDICSSPSSKWTISPPCLTWMASPQNTPDAASNHCDWIFYYVPCFKHTHSPMITRI